MLRYLKVNLLVVRNNTVYTDIIYSTNRFLDYNVRLFMNSKEQKGEKVSMFWCEDEEDEAIIECIKHREKDFPADKAQKIPFEYNSD